MTLSVENANEPEFPVLTCHRFISLFHAAPSAADGSHPPQTTQSLDPFGTNQCSCNFTSFLDELKFDDVLREKLRGPPGPHGKEGKPGVPGLTVSPFNHTINYADY